MTEGVSPPGLVLHRAGPGSLAEILAPAVGVDMASSCSEVLVGDGTKVEHGRHPGFTPQIARRPVA